MHYIDHLHRKVTLLKLPERIVSLVPSQTELLVELGVADRLVGVTKFCVHPSGLRNKKTIVGGTKNYRFEVIAGLKPDLIIGNKEENEKVGIEKLASEFPVWMSDVVTFEDSLRMILDIGVLTGTSLEANRIKTQLMADFGHPVPKKGSAVYLIWNDPMMVAGGGTFIDEMLVRAGFENLIKEDRYPVVVMEELRAMAPEYVLLSSEPFPFKEKHTRIFKKELPGAKIRIVDGEMFSWYGSRLLHAKAYFEKMD